MYCGWLMVMYRKHREYLEQVYILRVVYPSCRLMQGTQPQLHWVRSIMVRGPVPKGSGGGANLRWGKRASYAASAYRGWLSSLLSPAIAEHSQAGLAAAIVSARCSQTAGDHWTAHCADASWRGRSRDYVSRSSGNGRSCMGFSPTVGWERRRVGGTQRPVGAPRCRSSFRVPVRVGG